MPSRTIQRLLLLIGLLISIGLVIYYLYSMSAGDGGPLRASGTVEAVEVSVSPELAGRVMTVFVEEGEAVSVGDPLFQLDDTLLQAQRQLAQAALDSAQAKQKSAQAALEVAEAGVRSAQIQVDLASLQYQMTLSTAHFEARPSRVAAWQLSLPEEFSLPVWYFQSTEEIQSAKSEMEAAEGALKAELKAWEALLNASDHTALMAAETRLRSARAAFIVASETLQRAEAQEDQALIDAAQALFENAEEELEAAQSDYDSQLTDEMAEEINQGRAAVAVAQERYDIAFDQYHQRLTGEHSLQVQAAALGINQAEARLEQSEAQLVQAGLGLEQAEKLIAQTQAEIDLIDIQLDKLIIRAATSGSVTSRNIEAGEVLQPGAAAMTLSQLDTLTLTVYLPEDRYGEVQLRDDAQVTVDSFPNKVFEAQVQRIADRAEFTPRNVQTEEGRRTTVFAITLSIKDPQGILKPGMPADVVFASSTE